MSIFLAKPIEVEAVYFDGNNFAEVQKMCGMHLSSAKDWQLDTFGPLGNYFMSENPGDVAELWVASASTWVALPAYVWIIKEGDNSIWMTSEEFRNHYTMKTYV